MPGSSSPRRNEGPCSSQRQGRPTLSPCKAVEIACYRRHDGPPAHDVLLVLRAVPLASRYDQRFASVGLRCRHERRRPDQSLARPPPARRGRHAHRGRACGARRPRPARGFRGARGPHRLAPHARGAPGRLLAERLAPHPRAPPEAPPSARRHRHPRARQRGARRRAASCTASSTTSGRTRSSSTRGPRTISAAEDVLVLLAYGAQYMRLKEVKNPAEVCLMVVADHIPQGLRRPGRAARRPVRPRRQGALARRAGGLALRGVETGEASGSELLRAALVRVHAGLHRDPRGGLPLDEEARRVYALLQDQVEQFRRTRGAGGDEVRRRW